MYLLIDFICDPKKINKPFFCYVFQATGNFSPQHQSAGINYIVGDQIINYIEIIINRVEKRSKVQEDKLIAITDRVNRGLLSIGPDRYENKQD
jgi:hypothetical protein